MKKNKQTWHPSAKQQGAALVISLIMLMVMTLLAVSSMRTTNLQERLTANHYDHALIFQRVDSTLRTGERDALTFDFENTGTLASHFHTGDPTVLQVLAKARWLEEGSNNWAVANFPSVSDYKGPEMADGRYLIEYYFAEAPGEIRGDAATGSDGAQYWRLRTTARPQADADAHRARTALQSTVVTGIAKNHN